MYHIPVSNHNFQESEVHKYAFKNRLSFFTLHHSSNLALDALELLLAGYADILHKT